MKKHYFTDYYDVEKWHITDEKEFHMYDDNEEDESIDSTEDVDLLKDSSEDFSNIDYSEIKVIDIDKEIERLNKEKARLEGELKRVNGMLNNERFISKAPQSKVDEEKAKLEKYTNMMEQVVERLASLGK